jgi:transcriptional regulator with XRE-family HTH domain
VRRIYLKQAREKKHWTQEQLETASGVSQATISKLETRELMRVSFDTVVDLATALGVDPQALRFGPVPKRRDDTKRQSETVTA